MSFFEEDKMKRFISIVTAVVTVAGITTASLRNAGAFEIYDEPKQSTIFLKNGNFAEFIFLDEIGHKLKEFEIVMKNSAGVEVGRFVEDIGIEFTPLNSSGIREADEWQITEQYLANMVSPLVPRYVSESYYSEDGDPVKSLYNLHEYSPNNTINIDYLKEKEYFYNIYRVFSYPQGETTAFTIPANKMGIFVNERWENCNSRGYYKMGADGAKKYFDNNEMFGSLKVWSPKKSTSELRIGISEVVNPYNLVYPPQLQSKKTEYIKCKMNVAELFDIDDQLQTTISDDGKITYRDITFNLRKRTKNTWAMVLVTSGACTTVAMPGSAGNIEFYVDKDSRQMAAEIYVNYTDDKGGGWHSSFRSKCFYGKVNEFVVETPELHNEGGIILDNILAGQYTLELRSYDGEKAFQTSKTITIENSNYQQFFVTEFDTKFPLQKGDANGDNVVDSSDASRVLAEYAALSTGKKSDFTEGQQLAADANSDGKIDSTDASKILEHYANVSTGGKGTI